MASRTIAIRNAIVAYLQAYPFELDLDVRPSVLSPADLDQIIVRRLYVWPEELGVGNEETRGGPGLDVSVGFGLIQPLTENTLAEQDELIGLSEQIPLALFGERMAGAPMSDVAGDTPRVLFEVLSTPRSIFIASWSITYQDIAEK